MHRVGDGGQLDRLLRVARTYWGDSPSGERCVVAEVFDQDLRAAVRTLMVARALCGAAAARLVVLGDPEARQLAEVFGAVDDHQPETPPVALVTGRVDGGTPRDIPVVHVHGTGTLQAYALFPDDGPRAFEDELPVRVAAFFEQYVWPNREVIRASAERVAWRAKSGYQVRTDTDRRQLRAYGCARLGLDPGLPTITVTAHVPGRDTELFGTTARFAAAEESANWLFVDPVAPEHRHMRSGVGGLSTNILWSLTDVAVSFGDSDLPAFGIPVIQAGFSEGARCGATHLAGTASDQVRLLEEAVATHAKGETILGPEQRERARLWLWMRRCGADVPTQLLPHSAHGPDYPRVLAVNLRYVERDGDPLFSAVHRMWERREPLLTRFDFRHPAGLSTTLTPARSIR
ncbi:hypothetical protein [Nonomuraea wenchangensis]|uniref:Uncharacterized protein n=1 Tax=Nonomuraea wenchangensis TaxID=568860 RepID=A0A1I0HNI4_9ACTN|nr:hypothetical protein [Nonomuraea wenchangensis]SET85495.1 hypothetical protein SAMN05421811_104406 [Nonomuraea wenchangensis]